MKKQILKQAVLSLVLSGSVWAGCADLYTVVGESKGADGTKDYEVELSDFVKNNPTDAVLVELGRCFRNLLQSPVGGVLEFDGRVFKIDDAQEMEDF